MTGSLSHTRGRPEPLCECGCGETIPMKRGRFARFRPGHYSKTAAHRSVMASVDPALTKHVGENNGNWSGGRGIDPQGYVRIRVDGRQVREHRVIAERILGRPLRRGEVVHHKNGDKTDNRPENIEVLASQADHMRQHMTSEEARARGRTGHRFRSLAALAALSPADDGGAR